tara:strand:+ start:2144 stop:3286 length:1143 start_codon:yes stop_codon:yes gene_type:complete
MFNNQYGNLRISYFDKIKSVNYFLLFLILILFSFGLLALYSVADENFNSWPKNHLYRFLIGLFGIFFLSLIDIRTIFRFAYPIFILNLLVLAIIPLIGTETYGATRWIKIWGFSIQPSEFIKYTLILALAKYYHSIQDDDVNSIRKLIIPILIIAIPSFIVLTQPDLGTAVMIALGSISIFWVVGLYYRYFIFLFTLGIGSIPIAWQFLRDYQKDRVFTFFNPERDPLGNGYHILQSKIALGSGGLFGKGYLDGTQSHLSFLPEMHNDFIFTVFGEEFGFIGTISLLIIYLIIILISFRMAFMSRSPFARYLSVGVTSVFSIYVFVNISMVTGLIPVVGVPLPFLSYGGSSMLAVMCGFGLLMNCYIHQKINLEKGDFFN